MSACLCIVVRSLLGVTASVMQERDPPAAVAVTRTKNSIHALLVSANGTEPGMCLRDFSIASLYSIPHGNVRLKVGAGYGTL